MPLIVACPKYYVLVSGTVGNQVLSFAITDTKFYVPVVKCSIKIIAEILKQLQLSFKRKIKWNKYEEKVSAQERKKNLDHLINSIFQE